MGGTKNKKHAQKLNNNSNNINTKNGVANANTTTPAAAAGSSKSKQSVSKIQGGANVAPGGHATQLNPQLRKELSELVSRLIEIGYKDAANLKEEWDHYIEMQTIIERVRELEAPLQQLTLPEIENEAVMHATRLAKIDAFTKWAIENGLRTDCLRIAEFPGYQLGLQATRDIAADEEVLTIPRKLIFSEEQLENDPRSAPQYAQMSNLNLAYALFMEKLNPQSFWKPYIDILPTRYNTVLYYTIKEMEELRGSSAFISALRQCKVIGRQYAYLYKCAHLTLDLGKISPMGKHFKEHFCYELYRWAVSTVMTRENVIPRSNNQKSAKKPLSKNQQKQQNQVTNSSTIAALIPYWDMANHKPGKITSYFNMETGLMQSAAQEDVKAEQQYFIYYGDRTNTDLLVHNGFIDPNNRKDAVYIKLGLSSSDPLCQQRTHLLEQLNIPRSGNLQVLPAPNYISGQLLAFVRVFNMDADQLAHWSSDAARALDLLHIDCALDTNHETKTWQYLHTRLMLLLRVFPTTLEEDEFKLQQHRDAVAAKAQFVAKTVEGNGVIEPLSDINAMILEYRVIEKRILAAALEYAKERSKA